MPEAIATFLVVPWILLVLSLVASSIVIAFIENEWPICGFFVVAGFIALVDWATPGGTVLQFIAAHPWWFVGGIVAYVPLGCCYSLHRWYAHCVRKRREWDVQRKSPEFQSAYKSWLGWRNDENKGKPIEDYVAYRLSDYKPDPWKYKVLLTTWIAFWPFSFIWYVTHDFFEAVYLRMTLLYTHYRDKAFEGA